MPSPTEITVAQLARRIGTPDAPAIVDVCIDDDFKAEEGGVLGWRAADRMLVPQAAGMEAAGLVAAALGYSRLFKDDLAQLDAAMTLYDALYRWCRDATDETHHWPAAKRDA